MPIFVSTATAASPSNTTKTAVQLATGAAVTCKVVGFDITFDGADSTKTPIMVTLQKPTGASSGGSSFTPLVVGPETSRTASTTSRVNDTTIGGSAVVYGRWYIPPTGGFSYQYPLGRELVMKVSEFLELVVTTVTASGTPNYAANLWFEE